MVIGMIKSNMHLLEIQDVIRSFFGNFLEFQNLNKTSCKLITVLIDGREVDSGKNFLLGNYSIKLYVSELLHMLLGKDVTNSCLIRYCNRSM